MKSSRLPQPAAEDDLRAKDVVASGRHRKTYRITRSGRKLLEDARGKLRELVSELLEDKDCMHDRGMNR